MTTDLQTAALCLRLDHLAVRVSKALTAAGVEHALIKGATTARWLYPEGRLYRDVDVLVRASQLRSGRNALVDAGIANARHTRLGEIAQHSLQLTADTGAEIDLHVALPASPYPFSDDLWCAMQPRLEALDLDGVAVPVLDQPARCLVLAMHLLANVGADGQPMADLQRALRAVQRDLEQVRLLADALSLRAHLEAAVALAEGRPPDLAERSVALRLQGASSAMLQWDRIRRLSHLGRCKALLSEAFPTSEFLTLTVPEVNDGRCSTVRVRAQRVVRLWRAWLNR